MKNKTSTINKKKKPEKKESSLIHDQENIVDVNIFGESQLIERVITIRRNARTRKGGRIISFGALVVVGDGNCRIGFSIAKSLSVNNAVSKALDKAKRSMFDIHLAKDTILYPVITKYGATKITLLPASPGTGIIASQTVREIFAVTRAQNVLSKVHGSTNPLNVLMATMKSLQSIQPIKHFILKRGITYESLFSSQDSVTT
jgi:small subunit ribosomal protein S5